MKTYIFQQVRQKFAKYSPHYLHQSSHPFVNLILKICKVYFSFNSTTARKWIWSSLRLEKKLVQKVQVFGCVKDIMKLNCTFTMYKKFPKCFITSFTSVFQTWAGEVAELCYQTRWNRTSVAKNPTPNPVHKSKNILYTEYKFCAEYEEYSTTALGENIKAFWGTEQNQKTHGN